MKRTHGLTAMLFAAAANATSPSILFDTPLNTKVVPLTNVPYNQPRPKRTCTYYPGFVEKEIDLGEIGADEQTVIRLPKGAKPPACTSKIKNEIVLEAKEWQGYFVGSKGEYLFFNDGDSVNGGLAFMVFSARDGRPLFGDSRQEDTFQSVTLIAHGLALRYHRVWRAPCSMATDPAGCWNLITRETVIARAARPTCEARYKKLIRQGQIDASTLPKLGTMVGYNVEARYMDGKLTLTPQPGALECGLEN